MHAWESIQKTLEHIEGHIAEELPIEELAQMASLSPFYYQRLFSRLVKKPVKEYIKLRRLARGCDLIANKSGKVKILDAALDCGFGSHETFTRAFREAYGMTPEQYRENPVWLNQFDKPDLLLGYTMIEEGVPLISDGLVLEMKRHRQSEPVSFIGIRGYVPVEGQIPVGEETGVDMPGFVWEKFHSVKSKLPKREGGKEVGTAYFGDAPEGSFTYFAGAEVKLESGLDKTNWEKTDWNKELGLEGTSLAACFWELPAASYVICGFEAENPLALVTTAVNKAVKYSRLWLEEQGIRTESYGAEVYGESPDDGGACMELWMQVAEE